MTWSSRLPATSVRLRLAAWYVCSLLLLVLVFSALVIAQVYRRGCDDLDTALRAELARTVDRFVLGERLPGLSPEEHAFEFADEGRPTIDGWPMDERGQRSPAPQRLAGRGTALLPWPGDAAVNTGTGTVVRTPAGRWRTLVATARRPAVAGAPTRVAFQASLPMAALDDAIIALMRYFALGLMALLVLACIGGFWIAGRALAPISEIIRRTRAIRPAAVGERLPVPGTADEVRQLVVVINGLLARTETALRKEARFATEAAHELRTPLTAQRSVGELALRTPHDSARLWDAVAAMLEECEHMEQLIDGLLLIARADGGLLPRPAEAINVADIAESCSRALQPLAESRSQQVTVEAAPDLAMRADETLLRQALLNLLQNAMDHTPEGTHITVQARRTDTMVCIDVVDDGLGMPVFDASQVVRRPAARVAHEGQRQGLGLGLTIVRSLVRSQGGRMVVHSARGEGTRVTLLFEP